jgi:photosystem II stability/assembly factor-like uncharacterized protein
VDVRPPQTVNGLRLGFAALVAVLLTAAGAKSISNPGTAGNLWISRGPVGGEIQALVLDPRNPATLYAGSRGGGVYKTSDGGFTWNTVNNGLGSLFVRALAIDPRPAGAIYAGTDGDGRSGIFKSTDGGNTWSPTGGSGPQCATALAVEPRNPATVYAATCGTAVVRSTDGGNTWTDASSGLKGKITQTLVIDPQSPENVYLGTRGGVFKSSDGGGTWGDANQGLANLDVQSLLVDPKNAAKIYAGTHGGAFRSINGGTTWEAIPNIPTNSAVQSLALDTQTSNTIYAGIWGDGGSGVFKSTDGGANWSPMIFGLTDRNVTALVLDPQNPITVYAGTNAFGVFKTTSGGVSWNEANSGMTNSYIHALAVDPQDSTKVYAGASDQLSGIYQSSHDEGKMSLVIESVAVNALAIDPQHSATFYAGTDGLGVLKSSDGGGTWTGLSNGLTNSFVRSLAIDPTSPATLYAGTPAGGLFKTANGGTDWTAANEGLPDAETHSLAIDPQNPATIYAGTAGWGIFKSVNAGANWSAVNEGITPPADGLNVYALAVDPSSHTTVYAGIYGAGVFKSTDGGTNWRAANNGLTNFNVRALAIDALNPATIYVGTTGGGIFKSMDGGTDWAPFNDGLPNLDVYALATDPHNPGVVYGGTNGNGVFARGALTEVPLTMPAGGGSSISTVGPVDEPSSGYAVLTVGTGDAPYGTAVFGYRQNGVLVSEVGVPASPPTRAARFFVDSRTGVSSGPGTGTIDISTGFAAVNGVDAPALLDLKLRDNFGTILSQGSVRLARGEHIAKFLNQLAPDFVLPQRLSADGTASLEITSDQPTSVIALRLTINQRGDVLLTSTPVADLGKAPPILPLLFPQIADGGGYQTTLILMNTSNTVEAGAIDFYRNDGTPLRVSPGGAGMPDSRFLYTLVAGAFLRIVTDGSPSDVNVGWASLTPDEGTTTPVGAAIFSYTTSGVLITESGVAATLPTTHARIFIDKSGSHDTGIAVANPGSSGIRVTATAYQLDGVTPAGVGPATVDLASLGHDAKFAGELNPNLRAGFTGVLDLASTEPFAALTLRSLTNSRGDFLITTFPTADANQPPPTPLVFPQIADGGGYQTQIILLSTSGGTSKETAKYLGNDGSPIAVGRPGSP